LTLAIKCRKSWKEGLCESEDIEEYGFNEFIGGQAEAFENCIEIIEEHCLFSQSLSLDVITKELEKLAQMFEINDGDSIDYTDIYRWKEKATLFEINEMSNSIIKLMNTEFSFDNEEFYLVAESIIKKIKLGL